MLDRALVVGQRKRRQCLIEGASAANNSGKRARYTETPNATGSYPRQLPSSKADEAGCRLIKRMSSRAGAGGDVSDFEFGSPEVISRDGALPATGANNTHPFDPSTSR